MVLEDIWEAVLAEGDRWVWSSPNYVSVLKSFAFTWWQVARLPIPSQSSGWDDPCLLTQPFAICGCCCSSILNCERWYIEFKEIKWVMSMSNWAVYQIFLQWWCISNVFLDKIIEGWSITENIGLKAMHLELIYPLLFLQE